MCSRVLICSTENAPPTKVEQIHTRVLICTRVHFHKTPFIGPKYTPGANLHSGCIFAPGVYCAFERGLREPILLQLLLAGCKFKVERTSDSLNKGLPIKIAR